MQHLWLLPIFYSKDRWMVAKLETITHTHTHSSTSVAICFGMNVPLNSFFRKILKSSRPRRSFRSSKKLKDQRSTRILVGTWTLNTWMTVFTTVVLLRFFHHHLFELYELRIEGRHNRAPPSHIKSPIGVIVRLPGVAGCTGGQEGVMGLIGSGVLDQSAEIQLVWA